MFRLIAIDFSQKSPYFSLLSSTSPSNLKVVRVTVRIMVFNGTFNNISITSIAWRSVLLVEENGVPGENHRPVVCHWQTLSHNVVSSTPHLSEIWTQVCYNGLFFMLYDLQERYLFILLILVELWTIKDINLIFLL